jgi:hypothetical protein
VLAQFNQLLGNSTQPHYMPGMTEPNNVVAIAEWKAEHRHNTDQAQRVPVYVLCVILMAGGDLS